MKYKTILISDNDDKVECLKKCGVEYNLNFITSPLHFVLFPLYLVRLLFSSNKPDAVIVRYLNDHHRLFYSLIIFISRSATFFISKISGIKLIWFCHNIDKETSEHYPALTKLTRKLLLKFCCKIYVMDRLLVNAAQQQFPDNAHKIDYISFGARYNRFRETMKVNNDNILYDVFEKLSKTSGEDALVGFCPTNSGDKYLHIRYAPKLVEEARKYGIKLFIVLIGDLKGYLEKHARIKETIANEENVILIEEYVSYDAFEMSNYFDFYWRGLEDQSISYSIYEAATVRKPTLALNTGFIGQAVDEYDLGSVIDLPMVDVSEKIHEIKSWDKNKATEFLSDHSWAFSVSKISDFLKR